MMSSTSHNLFEKRMADKGRTQCVHSNFALCLAKFLQKLLLNVNVKMVRNTEMARSAFYASPRSGVLKKFDQNFCLGYGLR